MLPRDDRRQLHGDILDLGEAMTNDYFRKPLAIDVDARHDGIIAVFCIRIEHPRAYHSSAVIRLRTRRQCAYKTG